MQVPNRILDGVVLAQKVSLATSFTMILIPLIPLAMATATLSAHFQVFTASRCRSNSSCFLGSVLAHDSLDELCGVPYARPDSVDKIRLVDGTIHPIVCVVEVNKENQGKQHSSVFFSFQAMGCFGTLFKTPIGL